MSEMLDYGQAATLLGVKLGTLYSLVARKQIPFIRLGRRLVRFDRGRLEEWVASRAIEPACGTQASARRPEER